MDDIGDSIREAAAESFEQQIEEQGIDCTTEDCPGNTVSAEVWVSDSGGFEGRVLCQDCNTRIPLDMEDSDAQQGIDGVEDSLEDLEDTLDDF